MGTPIDPTVAAENARAERDAAHQASREAEQTERAALAADERRSDDAHGQHVARSMRLVTS